MPLGERLQKPRNGGKLAFCAVGASTWCENRAVPSRKVIFPGGSRICQIFREISGGVLADMKTRLDYLEQKTVFLIVNATLKLTKFDGPCYLV